MEKRIGIAAGRYAAPDDFDGNNDEAAEYLLRSESAIFPEASGYALYSSDDRPQRKVYLYYCKRG